MGGREKALEARAKEGVGKVEGVAGRVQELAERGSDEARGLAKEVKGRVEKGTR